MKKSQQNCTVCLVMWFIYILVGQQQRLQGLPLCVRNTLVSPALKYYRGSNGRKRLPLWEPGLRGRGWIIRSWKLEGGTMEPDKTSEEGTPTTWSLRGTVMRLVLEMTKAAHCNNCCCWNELPFHCRGWGVKMYRWGRGSDDMNRKQNRKEHIPSSSCSLPASL